MINAVFANLVVLFVSLPAISFGQVVYEQNFGDLFRNGGLNTKDREITLSPSLVVEKLNNNLIGKVGIFGTNADFESIRIEYEK
jgi:hypothetical protein